MLIHDIKSGSLNPNTNKTNRITKLSKRNTNKNPSNKATHITTQISTIIVTLFSTKPCAKIATVLAQNINIRSSKQQHNTIRPLYSSLTTFYYTNINIRSSKQQQFSAQNRVLK